MPCEQILALTDRLDAAINLARLRETLATRAELLALPQSLLRCTALDEFQPSCYIWFATGRDACDSCEAFALPQSLFFCKGIE
jgi:hypothetical protein